jgi:hypothetical protein
VPPTGPTGGDGCGSSITNAKVHADVVPKITAVPPQAVLMVVTHPPDHSPTLPGSRQALTRVFSAGTLIATTVTGGFPLSARRQPAKIAVVTGPGSIARVR